MQNTNNYKNELLEITNQQSDGKTALAITATFVSVLIMGVVPILIRWSENEISPNTTMFNRSLIAAIIFGIWECILFLRQLWLTKQPIIKQSFNKAQILLLLLTSALLCGNQAFWAWSLTQTSVANSALIHNLTPFFTALGGYLLFNQHFKSKFLLGLAITFIGAIFLGLNDIQINSIKLQGDLIAFVSTIFWSAYFIAIEKLRLQFEVKTILSCVFSITTLLFVPVISITHDEWFPNSWNGWLNSIALALTIIAIHVLLTYSLKYLSATFVAIVSLLDPIVTAFLAWIIFAEVLNWLNLVAFALIIVGVYIALTSEKRTVDQTNEFQKLSPE